MEGHLVFTWYSTILVQGLDGIPGLLFATTVTVNSTSFAMDRLRDRLRVEG